MGVGNLVFFDANGDGKFNIADGDVGIGGVPIELFRAGDNPANASPVATTYTNTASGTGASSSGGFYMFHAVVPGNYFLYVPPTAFFASGPLAGLVVPTGVNVGTASGDDQMGQDAIYDANPTVNGIKTATFTLAVGACPTNTGTLGELGFDGAADDPYGDANIDFTRDLGFRVPAVIAISPTSLPAATTTVNYNQALTASGGAIPYTWSLKGGSLPAGITLTSGGVLSGTATTPGTYTFSIQVADVNSVTAVSTYSLNVGASPIIISPSALLGAVKGSPYSAAFTASGGTPSYTWSLANGTSVPGLTLTPGGVLSGTPTSAGNSSIAVKATDNVGQSATVNYTIAIAATPLSITTTGLGGGALGQSYSATLTATGGTSPYIWLVSNGVLPVGLNLNPSTGIIAGVPSVAGTSTISIKAVDVNGLTAASQYSLTISSATITISPSTIGGAVSGGTFSSTLVASGGTAPYGWTITSGALPPGLTLSASTGTIAGTVTAGTTGTYGFTVRATDSFGSSSTASYAMTVVSPVQITTTAANVAPAYIGTAYSQTFSATGGVTPYSWTVQTGTLPDGLTLTPAGIIAGTPTTAGSSTITLKVSDSSTFATAQYTINVTSGTISISPVALASGNVATAYSQQMTATGGTSPYTWSIASGSVPGLTLNSSSGTFAGTPTTAGNYTLLFKVIDVFGLSNSMTYTFTVTGPPTITTTSLPTATQGLTYTATLSAAGGTPPYTWSAPAGSIPNNFSLSPSGVFTGTPTASGSGSMTFTVTDNLGASSSANLTFTVLPAPPTITTSSLPQAVKGIPYTTTLVASGGTPPYTWKNPVGGLAPGLSLNTSTGVLSGTPTSSGSGTMLLLVTDSAGASASFAFPLTILDTNLSITLTGLPAGIVGTAYTTTLTATGGATPYTWSLTSGTLPSGVTLNASTGILSGNTTAASSSDLAIKVTDSVGATQTLPCRLIFYAGPVAITPTSLGTITSGLGYSKTFTASGGTAPYTWSLATGTLPTGLTLNSSTGKLSGTPTVNGAYTFAIKATAANSVFATAIFPSVPVTSPVTITTVPANLTTPQFGTAYSQSLSASGGTSPYTWGVVGGVLPPGIVLNTNGTFSGTAVVVGTYTFTVSATDTITSTSATFTFNITGGATMTLSPTSFPTAVVGTAYSQALAVTGGTSPYSFSTSGTVPPGMALLPTGILSGTPSATGTFTFSVTAKDISNSTTTVNYSMSVTATAPPLAGLIRRDLTALGDPSAATNVPLAGVPVYLYADKDGDGVLSSAEAAAGPIQTDESDTSGHYVFAAVVPGNYLVIQGLLPGGIATYDTDGGAKDRTAVHTTGTGVANVDFLQCYDPTGVFYCSTDGQIVAGGKVAVAGPGKVTMYQDGTNGHYCLAVDTEGDYTIAVTAPSGYVLDTARAAMTGTWSSASPSATVKIGAGEDPSNPGYLSASTSAANPWYRSLHLKPSAPCPVDNNIPVLCNAPNTFVQWQKQNPGSNAVNDNADGDMYDNLMEYALGLESTSGVTTSAPFKLEVANGQVNAVFKRRSTGHLDITYRLEGSKDLATWSALPVVPAVEAGTTGTDTVRFTDLATAALFNGVEVGYVRLKVSLDADHNGTAEATSVSPAFAFSIRELPVAQTTFAMPLLQSEVFAGKVNAVSTSTIDVSSSISTVGLKSALVVGREYYLEVLDGTNEGLRIELDEASTTSKSIAVEAGSTVPTNLAGSRIAVRAHQTLNDVLPPTVMHASDTSATADRVMFFSSNAFEVMWLSNVSGQAHWVADTDTNQADTGSRIIGPAEGIMVQTRAAITLPVVGEVRANKFNLPLAKGAQFIGSGWPQAQSPASRNMNTTSGFTASTAAASADRVRTWIGDVSPGATAYDNYYFAATVTPQWNHEGGNTSVSADKFFLPFHASFVITTNGASNWTMPLPFKP